MDFFINHKGKEYCVEYHGKQHYVYNEYFKNARQKITDYNKKRYCYKNNIQYIEIPYTKDTLESVYLELKKYFKHIKKPTKVKIYRKPKLVTCDIEVYKGNNKVYKGNYSDILNRYEDITQTNMIKCLKGELDRTNGYRFVILDEYKELERINKVQGRKDNFEKTKYTRVKGNRVPVACMNIITGKEYYFESIKGCEKYFNINGVSVYLSDKGKTRKTINNLILRERGKEYKVTRSQALKSKQRREVKAIKKGTSKEITGGVNELARIIGASAPNISKVLKGKSKSCKGYTFEYLDYK